MDSIICTLFEGNYHFGVAALVNSLYYQGYRGNIYAGYRGSLPAWTLTAQTTTTTEHSKNRIIMLGDGLQLHLIPINTKYHLTNYKPDFMLQLCKQSSDEVKSIFYFDPDIVVRTPWSHFQEWINCGVALCEDINSPLSKFHPIRIAWRRYFGKEGFILDFKDPIYANGGFIGVSKENFHFLTTWQKIQETMAPAIGGLSNSAFTGTASIPFAPFGKTDQDALNATVEAWNGTVSFLGKEGMAFGPGLPMMSHALGKLKPWLCKPLKQLIKGHSPRLADRDYWSSANGVITSQPINLVRRRQIEIKLSALLARFYKRN